MQIYYEKYVHRTEYISVVNAHEWDDDEAMTLVPSCDEGINEQLLGEKTAHPRPPKLGIEGHGPSRTS